MSTDHRGNPTGTNNKAKTNAERVGRAPTEVELERQQEISDQHAIAHADGFIGPRISEVYGRTGSKHEAAQPMPYQTKDGGNYLQPDPSHQTYDEFYGVPSGGTAGRMAHLDKTVSHVKPRMFQHRGTGTVVEQWNDYKGERKTNEFGTAASGRSLSVRHDSSLSGKPHSRGLGDDLNPEDFTDITDTVRGTQTYKRRKNS